MATSDTSRSQSLTCAVVEDQRMFLQPLVALLQTHQGLDVRATATTAAEGVPACQKHRPDLLILDLSLPDQSGIVVAETLMAHKPEARLIYLREHSVVTDRGMRGRPEGWCSQPQKPDFRQGSPAPGPEQCQQWC